MYVPEDASDNIMSTFIKWITAKSTGDTSCHITVNTLNQKKIPTNYVSRAEAEKNI
jgi:hypothetical protein